MIEVCEVIVTDKSSNGKYLAALSDALIDVFPDADVYVEPEAYNSVRVTPSDVSVIEHIEAIRLMTKLNHP